MSKKKMILTNQKVKDASPNNFSTLDHIWAEKGVVRWRDNDTGRVGSMTVSEAVAKMNAIQAQPVPKWHMQQRDKLVTHILDIVRKAQYQLEAPVGAVDGAVANLLQGKQASGKPMPRLVDLPPEEMMKEIHMRFPLVTQDEIMEVVLRQGIALQDKVGMLSMVNQDRGMALMERARAAQVVKASTSGRR